MAGKNGTTVPTHVRILKTSQWIIWVTYNDLNVIHHYPSINHINHLLSKIKPINTHHPSTISMINPITTITTHKCRKIFQHHGSKHGYLVPIWFQVSILRAWDGPPWGVVKTSSSWPRVNCWMQVRTPGMHQGWCSHDPLEMYHCITYNSVRMVHDGG